MVTSYLCDYTSTFLLNIFDCRKNFYKSNIKSEIVFRNSTHLKFDTFFKCQTFSFSFVSVTQPYFICSSNKSSVGNGMIFKELKLVQLSIFSWREHICSRFLISIRSRPDDLNILHLFKNKSAFTHILPNGVMPRQEIHHLKRKSKKDTKMATDLTS